MKQNSFIAKLTAVLLMLCYVCSFCSLTAFAEGEVEQGYSEDLPITDIQADDQPQDQQPEDTPADPDPEPQPDPEPEPQPDPDPEPMYEYIYSYPGEDVTSAYEEPQYLDELPAVTSQEVVEATAVVIPDVAVSDASLLSGSIMWLCVALGIAVIVGVLVSKRTRRRGV